MVASDFARTMRSETNQKSGVNRLCVAWILDQQPFDRKRDHE
ncbi:hypothetical protein RSSM_01202 [Rhodopirellula sallentina SM41]|uniref:Uncharacterized protein n=2 Tax=Rhodopirellula TaxID=265488 RepID=M5UHP3_9BACT|nr:hypothetical protein RSSM_01202 [Rhodopirellula sallentina SM41]